MFPFIDTAPRAARPMLVLSIVALNAIVFLWTLGLTPRQLDAVFIQYALIPARYMHPALARSVGLDPNNYWPLVTDAFLHGGWLHIIFNMWFLWIFGPAMEARFGRIGFLFLYLGGAVAASAVQIVTSPDTVAPVLGASGAIAAVVAAYAVIYPAERVICVVPILFIPLFVPIPAILFALIWFALQVWQGTTDFARPDMAEGVAWWAHIGGFAFGAAFALIVRLTVHGPQTRVQRWDDMAMSRTRGKRVPDARPKDWNQN